jgi:hypothetical protein
MASADLPPRRRLWAVRLALVASGLVVGLTLAEGLARLVGPPLPGFVLDATLTAYEPRLYTRHPTRITTLAPNADVTLQAIEYQTRVRTDRLGLRGAPPNDGDVRVAFVGDSFTLGVQVAEADTFVEQTAAAVQQQIGRRVVGLNGGVDGYGVLQSVDRLEELLRFTRATHAVLTVYLGNDLRDDFRLAEKQAAMNRPPPMDDSGFDSLDTMRRKSALARVSRLYAWVAVVKALRAGASDFRIEEYADELKVFTDSALRDQQLAATARGLDGFGRTCRAHRLTCVVALAPPAWAVEQERAAATFASFGLSAEEADLDGVVAAVRSSVPRGIEVLDLTPSLREAARNEPTYFTFDPHWTAAGHRAVAKALSRELP